MQFLKSGLCFLPTGNKPQPLSYRHELLLRSNIVNRVDSILQL